MADGNADRLFDTRWVHLFEEDTAKGEVYAPDDGDIPLSRRPRGQLALRPDGSATTFVPGPDDRLVPRDATWTERDSRPTARAGSGGDELRIVERSPGRIVVARSTGGA